MVESGPSSKRFKMASGGEGGTHVGFIGGGNLARAITEGLLQADDKQKRFKIHASFATNGENYKKMQSLGVAVTTNNKDIVLSCDVIVLSVKPHQVLPVLDELRKIYKDIDENQLLVGGAPLPRNLRPLIVSVATSITIKQIEEKTEISWKMGRADMLGHLPVIRCLPTVASSVRAGVTVYTSGHYSTETDNKLFLDIFNSVGFTQDVPEQYIDGFTAFTGSGVAFMGLVMEALADGGVLVGIPRGMADKIAAYTMMSTAKIVIERGIKPHEIRTSVASPGGTTIHGLKVMEDAGVRGGVMGAVQRGTERAKELRPPS